AFQQPVVAASASALVILGFVLAFVFFARSARARKARDEAVSRERQLRRQFDAILGTAVEGVIITSSTGEIVLMTEVAGEVLGVSRSDAVGRPLARLPIRVVDEHLRSAMPGE